MEEVEKLRKKRKPFRGVITKLMNKIDEALKEDRSQVDERKLQQYKVNLNNTFETLKELDEEIFEGLVENDADDDICEKEVFDASDITEKVTFCLICLEESLKGEKESKSPQVLSRSSSKESLHSVAGSVAESRTGSVTSDVSNASSGNHRRVRAKLPKLELSKFNGKVVEWQEFWDGFKSAIHDDDELAKVDKFKYLRSFPQEPAKSVVAGLPLTDADYDAAVELLQKRFARPAVIKGMHIHEMIHLPPVYSERNIVKLRNLHDQIETHFRGLEALGADKESYSTVVVPWLMQKVPETLRYNMIRFAKKDQLEWTVDEFIQAFGAELEVRECQFPVVKTPQQDRSFGRPNSENKKEWNSGTAAALVTSRDGEKCVYCLEATHKAENCDKIKSIEGRKKLLLKFAKCFNCLKGGHRAYKCRSNTLCKVCKDKHHSSICSEGSATKSSLAKEAQPKPSSSLNPAATSWVGTTGSSGDTVVLQTALAKVNDKKECRVRVLFDTGSQKTFITAKAVGRLGLEAVREESLGIRAFGSKDANVSKRKICKLSLSPIRGDGKINVEAFVVKDISNIAN